MQAAAGMSVAQLDTARDAVRDACAKTNQADDQNKTNALDELEPLVLRFRAISKGWSRKLGRLWSTELRSLLASARLHEVLCICNHCFGNPFALLGPGILPRHTESVRGSTLLKPPAPLEPSPFSRHAGGRKRPRGRCALCSP